MRPESRSSAHRALLPRVVLIATVALAAFLLWPVAAALRDALAALVQARGDLIASALLVIALLLAIDLVRIVFAFGRRLDAQAEQAAIMRLENEHPVHVADVRQSSAQLIERSLAWHYQTEHTRLVGMHCSSACSSPRLPSPIRRASAHRSSITLARMT